MAKSDYYRILGIPKNAEENEIKKAYKRLAIKFHPDRNPGNYKSEEKFKEIKEAYEVLIDPQKRSAYDQYGHSAFDNAGMGNANSSADFTDIFGDVFGDIFGGNRKKKSRRGEDLQCNIELTLEEAVRGVNKEIRIPILEECIICMGSGNKPGTFPIKCSICYGKGQIQIRQGFFTVQQTCHSCNGNGKIIRNPCRKCRGIGKTESSKTLSVKIPQGVNTGDKIRLSGEGAMGDVGSSKGDLYVQIKVKKHPIFNREEENLYCEVPINFSMAALGGEIEIPTLDGKIKLKIPAETQTGKLFRMRKKGVKSIRNNSKGDLFCKVVVETPVRLSDFQKQLLLKLAKSFSDSKDEKNSPKSKSFFDSVKKFFEDLRN